MRVPFTLRFLIIAEIAIIGLVPILGSIGSVAQQGPQLRANPTETPGMPIGASPTETASDPGSFQVASTETPPSEVPDLPLHIEPTGEPQIELPDEQESLQINATLRINIKVCDGPNFDPYDPANATYMWGWQHACSEMFGQTQLLDIELSATDGAAYAESATIPWGENGVEFTVPASTITASTTIPTGFSEPVSTCLPGAFTPFGNPPPDGAIQHTTGSSFTVSHESTTTWYCNFYYVTSSPLSSSVTLNTWLCPANTGLNQTLSELLDLCANPHNDIGFTLVQWAQPQQPATTVDGQIVWESVSIGSHTIFMDSVTGVSESAAFCGFTESPGGGIQHPAQIPVEQAVLVDIMIAAPEQELICHWFNVPA